MSDNVTQRDRGARDHFPRQVTDEQARQAAKNFIDAHCRNEGGKGVQMSIPARPDDDDLLLVDYIKQQSRHRSADAARIAELEREVARLREALTLARNRLQAHTISAVARGDTRAYEYADWDEAATTALGGQS